MVNDMVEKNYIVLDLGEDNAAEAICVMKSKYDVLRNNTSYQKDLADLEKALQQTEENPGYQ
jgi:hypothetical protein